MTITSKGMAKKYDRAKEGHYGPALQGIAEAADMATGAVLQTFIEHGQEFPGDDRCYNLEVEIFRIGAEHLIEQRSTVTSWTFQIWKEGAVHEFTYLAETHMQAKAQARQDVPDADRYVLKGGRA